MKVKLTHPWHWNMVQWIDLPDTFLHKPDNVRKWGLDWKDPWWCQCQDWGWCSMLPWSGLFIKLFILSIVYMYIEVVVHFVSSPHFSWVFSELEELLLQVHHLVGSNWWQILDVYSILPQCLCYLAEMEEEAAMQENSMLQVLTVEVSNSLLKNASLC